MTKSHALSRVPAACALLLLSFATVSCDRKPAANTGSRPGSPPTGASGTAAASLPASLFVSEAPKDARGVKDTKAGVKKGDTVTVAGWVGGSKKPFVEGRAVFTIIDASLPDCEHAGSMPDCKTPWDLCCDTPEIVGQHIATVQIVDAAGSPLRAAAQGTGGLKPLAKVVVVGKVAQADNGVLVVNAEKLYIAP